MSYSSDAAKIPSFNIPEFSTTAEQEAPTPEFAIPEFYTDAQKIPDFGSTKPSTTQNTATDSIPTNVERTSHGFW